MHVNYLYRDSITVPKYQCYYVNVKVILQGRKGQIEPLMQCRQDKTRQDNYFSDPQIKNIKYIQIVMYDSYWGGNEGSSIILNRLSTCYPQT